MVKLEEVADEELLAEQQGPIGGEDDWDDTDTESEVSDAASESSPESESLLERIAALKDIISPQTRQSISKTVNAVYGLTSSTLSFSGKALWVVSSSALLLGVPWALAYAEEQQMVEMEREMKMQQTSAELLTPGASTQQAGQPAKAAL